MNNDTKGAIKYICMLITGIALFTWLVLGLASMEERREAEKRAFKLGDVVCYRGGEPKGVVLYDNGNTVKVQYYTPNVKQVSNISLIDSTVKNSIFAEEWIAQSLLTLCNDVTAEVQAMISSNEAKDRAREAYKARYWSRPLKEEVKFLKKERAMKQREKDDLLLRY